MGTQKAEKPCVIVKVRAFRDAAAVSRRGEAEKIDTIAVPRSGVVNTGDLDEKRFGQNRKYLL
jgi:hypothetical protein